MYSLRTYELEEIFPLVPESDAMKVEHELDGYSVKFSSQRLITFKHSNKCVCCGIVGNKFILEYGGRPERYGGAERPDPKKFGSPHLNLYSISDMDSKVLMTKDHIISKVNGGK